MIGLIKVIYEWSCLNPKSLSGLDGKYLIGLKTLMYDHGSRGYRSPHLAHAKRALYHLSYAPASSIGHVSLALES